MGVGPHFVSFCKEIHTDETLANFVVPVVPAADRLRRQLCLANRGAPRRHDRAGCHKRSSCHEPFAQTRGHACVAGPEPAGPEQTGPEAEHAAPAATPVPAATAAPALPGDPKSAIIAAMQNQMKAGPYRTTTNIVSDSGTIEMTGEIVPPDKIHTVMKMADFENENIFIGEQGWTKKEGVWEVSPVSGSMILEQVGLLATEDSLSKTISNVQAVGTDEVNGERARVYTYTSTYIFGEAGADQIISQVKLWVSEKRGLPVKQEIEGEAGGIKSKTVQIIEYDATITIKPPM